MSANAQTTDLRENLMLRSDVVFSRPGAMLTIAFSLRFSARNAARLVLSANGRRLRVFSAMNYGPGGNMTAGRRGGWTRVVLDYTTRDRLVQLSFSYQLDHAPANTIAIDQVAIFRARPDIPPPVLTKKESETAVLGKFCTHETWSWECRREALHIQCHTN
ncbi:hypothetical protein GQX73_g6947 [Xylaria multiplex]|uniref:Uncharacterized protein n=1 Tax=Xylaria multiplex TaxID=323545 RepID=A0A7C8ILG9_9PEZI|nr:hypothetical protein GQX73_g6947 [Xylaria multiplex]